MDLGKTAETITASLVGLAVVVALVAAKANTSQVLTSGGTAASDIFGTILSPVGGQAAGGI